VSVRAVLGGVAAAALTGGVLAGVLGLPDVGHAGGRLAQLAATLPDPQRHVSNAVSAVVFDLRGFDTLVEEFILFASALGATLLLRAQRSGDEPRPADDPEAADRPVEALSPLGALLAGPIVLFCLYIVAHGTLTPGGGFQGGVLAAGVLLVVHAAGRLAALEDLRPVSLVEVAEATGALAYALVGIGGVLFASAAFENFLGPGTSGSVFSGGTIPILQWAVGIEVAGGITLILSELLDQLLGARGESE
jgi:multicomponent Na+:H+ antiporter subunit B